MTLGSGIPCRHSRASTPELELSDTPPRSSDSPSEFSVGGFTRRSPSSGGLSDLSSLSSHSFTDEAHSELEDSSHSDFELVHASHNAMDSSWTDALEGSHSLADIERDDTPQASTLYHDSLFASSSLRFPDPQFSRGMSPTPESGASPSLSDHASLPIDRRDAEAVLDVFKSQHAELSLAQADQSIPHERSNIEVHRHPVLDHCVTASHEPINVNSHDDNFGSHTLSRTHSQVKPLDPLLNEAGISNAVDDKTHASPCHSSIQYSSGTITDSIDAVRKACVATLVLVGVVCLAVYSTKLPSAPPTPCIRTADPAVVCQPPTPRVERLNIMNKCNQTLRLGPHESTSPMRTPRPTNALIRRPIRSFATTESMTVSVSTDVALSSVPRGTTTKLIISHMPTSPACTGPARLPPMATAETLQRPFFTANSVTAHVDLALQHAYFALSMTFQVLAEEFQDFYNVYVDQSLDLLENTWTLLKSYRDQYRDWAKAHQLQVDDDDHYDRSVTSDQPMFYYLDREMMLNSVHFHEARNYVTRVVQGGQNVWNRPSAAAANFCRFAFPISLRPPICDASWYKQNQRRSRRHVVLGHDDSIATTFDDDDNGDKDESRKVEHCLGSRVRQGLGNVIKRPHAALANSCRFFLRGMVQPTWCSARHHVQS